MIILFIISLIASCGSPHYPITCNKVNNTNYCTKNKKNPKGEPGDSCTTKNTSEGAVIECEDGSRSVIEDGSKGPKGEPGVNGKDGESCSVNRVNNGSIIKCKNSTSIIYDGKDGKNRFGTVIEIIDPCGDYKHGFDEILLRVEDGSLISHNRGNKNKQFLTVLEPGVYITVDKQKCRFKITDSLEVVEL